MQYKPVIGLEIHIELKTASKMFCSCSAQYFGHDPNTHTCPVCLALPGALPVPNEEAIKRTLATGLALNCKINSHSYFERKSYFYPDLPKGFQISQYALPFCRDGFLEVSGKKIGINRVHLEEDTAKLIHVKDASLIDFNRSGMPLLEIVSQPEIDSASEAKIYCQKIQQIVRYLDVSNADMERGSMRCEANISLYKYTLEESLRNTSEVAGTDSSEVELPNYKVEVKNLNSFRSVERAIEYEIQRQKKALEAEEKLTQETRGWDEVNQKTVVQRTKEFAQDYRYFPEPDIPPMILRDEDIKRLGAILPELPDHKKERFIKDYGLSGYDAEVLTYDKALADFFEEAAKAYAQTKTAGIKAQVTLKDAKAMANWIIGPVLAELKEKNQVIASVNFTPADIAEIQYLIDQGQISFSIAKAEVLPEIFKTGNKPAAIISEKDLGQISQARELEKIADEVLKENPQLVVQYQKGKTGVLGFFVGEVMKKTSGRAKPKLVGEILKEKLK